MRDWRRVFLEALRHGKRPSKAADLAGVSRSTPYSRRRVDRAFARDWRDAEDEWERKQLARART